MKDSLGARTHYDHHLRRGRLSWDPGNTELPDIHARNYAEQSGVTAHRSHIYPSGELVRALDVRAGRAGWQERDVREEAALLDAMAVLRIYDPVMADVVRLVCLEGRWHFRRGRGLVHLDWEPAARLIDSGDGGGGLDDRKTWDWLQEAWAVLGICMLSAHPEEAPQRRLEGRDLKHFLQQEETHRVYLKLKARDLI